VLQKLSYLNKLLNWRQLLFWICFQSASNLVRPSLVDVESFKNCDNFKILIQKRLNYEILLIWHN